MSSGAAPSPDFGPDPAAVGPDQPPDPRVCLLDDAVRRELVRLGSDAGTAPDVPAEVTARVGAALRGASHPAGHTLPRPGLTRAQWTGLLIGIGAVVVAVVVGALTLTRDPEPRFPSGPTASRITVAAPQTAFPWSDEQLRAALAAPPDLGPLADPQRRASCLAGLGYSPALEVLGGRPLDVSGRPVILMLLPGLSPEQMAAVAVEPSCSAKHTGLLAETVVHRR